jgi:hypothetical protein
MCKLESYACSFLHALFSHKVLGMEFLVRRAHVGCEGRSSRPNFELYLCLFLYEYLLGHSHNLVAKGAIVGKSPYGIWAKSHPRRGPKCTVYWHIKPTYTIERS